MDPIKTLEQEIKAYAEKKHYNLKKIVMAIELAKKLHSGQTRKSGEPFVIHPLTVAYYATQYNADEASIITGLLHDAVEDTEITISEVKSLFGWQTANLVEGLTKFTKEEFIKAHTIDSRIETLRKWFQTMQKDVRVGVLRLLDRLHNMETLSAHNDKEKEAKIARQTMDIFVKIAEKFCIHDIKNRLEDLTLQYIDNDSYQKLENIRKQKESRIDRIFEEIQSQFKKIDKEKRIIGIEYERPSLLKLYRHNIQEKEDIKGAFPHAFTIITKNKNDCYHILYLAHSIWKAELKSLKDYINNPAANGYRGLHTNVILKEGRHVKLKIRTEKMHEYYHFGITLQCFGEKGKKQIKFDWLKHLEHITKEGQEHSLKFWEQLQHDILQKSIIVRTDKHNTLFLPQNSTALDAAFYSYGRKAFRLKKIMQNGISVPFFKHLNHNDIVKFKFSKEPEVKYEWLEYVDTALATSLIKEGLKKTSSKNKDEEGRRILYKVLKKEGKGYLEEIDKPSLAHILQTHKIKSIKALYEKVATGLIDPYEIAKLISEKSDVQKEEEKRKLTKLSVELASKEEELRVFEVLQTFSINIEKYSFRLKKNGAKVTAYIFIKTKDQQVLLENYLKKHVHMKSIKFSQKREEIKIALLVFGIIFFWGLEPTLAYYVYKISDIKPWEIIFIRFWLTLIPMMAWMVYNYKIRKNKIVPLFNKHLILASLFLFGVVFFRYNALRETIPALYNIINRNHVFVSALSLPMIVAAFKKDRTHLVQLFLLFVAANIVILGLTPNWAWSWKIFSLMSALFFGFFTIQSRIFFKKFDVQARYYQFITLVYLYCTILITIIAGVSFQRVLFLLKENAPILIALSASVFIPYIFWYKLFLKYNERNYAMISFALTWMTTVLADKWILGIPLNAISIISGLLITFAIYLLTKMEGAKWVGKEL